MYNRASATDIGSNTAMQGAHSTRTTALATRRGVCDDLSLLVCSPDQLKSDR